jgi:nitroimidazol reductase NimA-like FMN-containing flavoprotein (pyridoxamine 5'-phosphate oxidase superfamily)
MLGELNTETMDELLETQLIGRIGCHAEGVTYIIPVNYVYHDPYIYAHSTNGIKLHIMRKNPELCFEVDKIESLFNWQSVICWGTFEEITEVSESEQAMQKIIGSMSLYLSKSAESHPSHGFARDEYEIGISLELVIYRIHIKRKTGRFEKE